MRASGDSLAPAFVTPDIFDEGVTFLQTEAKTFIKQAVLVGNKAPPALGR